MEPDPPPRAIKRPKIEPPSAEKERYLIEAAAFAAEVAKELNEPDAEKIFCPAFKVKACGCVQRFITGADGGKFPSEGGIRRATDLLHLHQEARRLKSKISTDRNDKGDKRVLRMLRAEGFERFIIINRSVVRQEMGICERACQRLLFYSNNFLHKDLKTGPEKGPRIKRMGGRKLSQQFLKPIVELAKEVCCPDRCVRITLTQHKLVESWRKMALCNQQGVRKAVQEMLSDNCEQTNCHKFITMVTGCSFSVIYKAKEQIRRTNGQHASQSGNLWQRGNKRNKKTARNNVGQQQQPIAINPSAGMQYAPNHSTAAKDTYTTPVLPTANVLNGPQHDLHRTNVNAHHAPEIQFQMEQPPTAFSHQFIQTLSTVNPSQVMNVPSSGAESPPQSHTLTVLGPASSSTSYISSHPHFQFMDNHHPQVLISVPEALQGQAISVLTSPTGLEPLTSNPFGNVVILPESAIFMPGPHHIPEAAEVAGPIAIRNMEL